MKFAAIAILSISSAAWAEQPSVSVSLSPGQHASVQVSKDQPVVMACVEADQTVGEARANAVNRKVAATNASTRK